MAINIKRVFAALIDYMIIVATSTTVAVLCDGGEVTPFSGTVFLLLVFLIALFKDFALSGASIGKRALKIKVMSCNDAELNFSKFFKRTITFVLVPVEFLLMAKNNKRIGDIWAKTTIVPV